MRKCDYHPYIDQYIDRLRAGEIPASKELLLACDLIERKLDNPDVFIDTEKIDAAVDLIERYFEFTLMDWELFVIALIHCYYRSTDTVVFDEIFLEMGRGNGKNGFISGLVFYLVSDKHGIKGYNVDIVANNEEQAQTSFQDVYEVLEDKWEKLKRFFYKSLEKIFNLRTRSYIKFNTSNAKTKDGKRTACLVFDEIHGYEDWEQIKVFQSGFGKRKHSRSFFITTNGYVRGGVLDEQLDLAQRVLAGEAENLRFLPLIYKLDDEEELKDPRMWVKANPSLPYFPELRKQIEADVIKAQYQPQKAVDLMTKRMNIPKEQAFTIVAPWEKILATNQPIPYDELRGAKCIGAVDYAQITDFASVGLLFKHKKKRVWIEHTFVCRQALKIESRRFKFPVEEMADRGLITIVNGESITAEHIAQWFLTMAKTYHILNIVGDRYRIELLRAQFTKDGLPLEAVASGPITHAKVAPLIESSFAEETFVFGDNPTMRWYVNNTCVEIDPKGNTTYLKIEPKLRKTDGFFALVHALSKDSDLPESGGKFLSLDVYVHQ